MARPKSLAEAQTRHDAKRAARRHVVRLSQDEEKAARALCKRGETVSALLRRLLQERIAEK